MIETKDIVDEAPALDKKIRHFSMNANPNGGFTALCGFKFTKVYALGFSGVNCPECLMKSKSYGY